MADPERTKSRIVWAAIMLAAAVAFYFWGREPAAPSPARTQRNVERARQQGVEPPPPAIAPVAIPLPVAAPPPVKLTPPAPRLAPEMVIPIQDRATIDFSIGAPVVRSGGTDTEVLDRALREMEEATKNVTFPPPKPPPSPPGK